MFFRCSKYYIDKHLHCISYGEILPDDEDLREMVKAGVVYNYRFSCEKLCGYDDIKSSP